VALKKTQKLAKFLTYVLGRRPDEFGLVPEKPGYVRIKELLKALNQEQGWRHIRLAHLKEVALTVVPSPIEIKDDCIRACDRTQMPCITEPAKIPKLLYLAVRSRAYPVIVEKGLTSGNHPTLVLSSDEAMARRLGQRRDPHPVMLTVQVAQSMKKGTQFKQYGEHLFLADALYPDTFSGPPLPKEKPGRIQTKTPAEPTRPKTPGSYYPDISPPKEPKRQRRKEVQWKKDRRNARKHKSRQQG
jgi:putative RNA 2'-phosphotransferase